MARMSAEFFTKSAELRFNCAHLLGLANVIADSHPYSSALALKVGDLSADTCVLLEVA